MRVIRGAADIWSECKSIQNGREPRGYGKDSIEKQLWLVPNRLPTAALDSSNRPVTSRDLSYFNIFKINLKRCDMIFKIRESYSPAVGSEWVDYVDKRKSQCRRRPFR